MEDSELSRRENELFSPRYEEKQAENRSVRLTSREVDLPHSWGNDDSQVITPLPQKGKSAGLLFLLVSFFILVLTIGFTGWKFLNQKNTVSASNIGIDIVVPPSIEGGEVTPLSFSIQNSNPLPLLGATLTFTYEKGSGSQDEQNKIQQKIDLGDIAPSEVRKGDISIQLYGEENSSRSIEVRLDYKVNGSNAVFNKTITTSSLIKTAPLSIHIDSPDTIVPLQSFPITITVKNNTSTSSEAVLASISLPATFIVQKLTPAPLGKSTVWQIPVLSSGGYQTIVINGYVKGNPGEVVSYKAIVGSPDSQTGNVGTIYAFDTKEVALNNPGLTVSLSANHEDGSMTSGTFFPGERVHALVTYQNDSHVSLSDATIHVVFKNPNIDPRTVTVDSGLYDSDTGMITWAKETNPILASLAADARGSLGFTFVVGTSSDISIPYSFNVDASADTLDNTEHFISKNTSSWFIEAGASAQASLSFKDTTFINTGALPPVANKVTTYTIILSATAPNGFQNGSMSLTLPLYVTWNNAISAGQNITYDTRSRRVTWTIPQASPKQMMQAKFQVAFKPSLTQVGSAPQITSAVTFNALDSVAQTAIKKTLSPVVSSITEAGGGNLDNVVAGQ